jgi:hypothetical protein
MTEEKLTSESLGNALELITDTIYEAMDKLYPEKGSWPHKKRVYEAWNLLCMFGDLDDNDGVFDEFAYQYNQVHGLE